MNCHSLTSIEIETIKETLEELENIKSTEIYVPMRFNLNVKRNKNEYIQELKKKLAEAKMKNISE